MKPGKKITVSSEDWVHITSNSGLRLRGNDPRYEELGSAPALPFLVIESSNGFQPVWGETELRLVGCREGLEIEGGNAVGDPLPSLEKAVDLYRKVHPLPAKVPSGNRRRVARSVTFDLWLPEGRIANRYSDASDLVKELSRQGLAADTLLYVPGWSGPYDARFPHYAPVPELGGEKEFGQLVGTCRKHGVILMPHLNFWGYDITTGLIPDYKQFQLHDAEGKPMEWAGVLRSGFTNHLAFMNVDDPRWTDLFFSYVDPLVSRWELEALFLDQIGSAPTPEVKRGSLRMLEHLHALSPQLVIGGEILAEFVIPHIDVIQAWGLPWCGLMTDFSDAFSPFARLLYGPAVTFVAHLGIPCALPCRYAWTNYPYIVEKGYQAAFEECQRHLRLMGGVPHVRIAHGLDPASLAALRG